MKCFWSMLLSRSFVPLWRTGERVSHLLRPLLHWVDTSTVDIEGGTDKRDTKANIADRATVKIYSILTGLVAECFLTTVEFPCCFRWRTVDGRWLIWQRGLWGCRSETWWSLLEYHRLLWFNLLLLFKLFQCGMNEHRFQEVNYGRQKDDRSGHSNAACCATDGSMEIVMFVCVQSSHSDGYGDVLGGSLKRFHKSLAHLI